MNNTTKRFTIVLGIFLSVAMVASLILPLLSGGIGQSDFGDEAQQPTPLPEPTFPPPPDIATIDFDSTYLHPSGLFTVAAPTGWLAASNSNTADELRAGLSNSDAQSVVEARIIKNYGGISAAEELSDYFDRDWLQNTWREYWSWDETSRKITDEGRVLIDFNLTRSRSYYIARQESWLQDGDIFSVRVVTPENAPSELKFLLEGVAKSVRRLEGFADAPFDWHAYFDNLDKHFIRYPADWQLTDGAAGLPATIAGETVTLVVETSDVALASEADAINWIEQWRDGLEALTVEAIDVGDASGYRVAYQLETLDGAIDSGLSIMLHGSDNRLHVANARLADTDLDLLQVDALEYPLLAVLDSFRLMPDLEVAAG